MVECFSNEVRRCCMKVEDVEEGEVWKGYIHECIRQRVGEGHRENGLQLEKSKLSSLNASESSMKIPLFYVSITAIVSPWYIACSLAPSLWRQNEANKSYGIPSHAASSSSRSSSESATCHKGSKDANQCGAIRSDNRATISNPRFQDPYDV